MNKPLARNVTFDEATMWGHLVDGRTLGIPLAYFPRLLNASVEHLLMGHGDRTGRPVAAG